MITSCLRVIYFRDMFCYVAFSVFDNILQVDNYQSCIVSRAFHGCCVILSGALVMTSRLPLHHVTSDDDVITTSSSPEVGGATTSGGGVKAASGAGRQVSAAHPLSIGYVTAALVLGFLCLVLGLVYGYIHFTRISPRFTRAARLFDHGGRGADAHNASTHIFIRNSKL